MPSQEDCELVSSFQMVDVCDELAGAPLHRPPAALDGPLNDAGECNAVEASAQLTSMLRFETHRCLDTSHLCPYDVDALLKWGGAMKVEHTSALEKCMSPSNSNEGGLTKAAGEGSQHPQACALDGQLSAEDHSSTAGCASPVPCKDISSLFQGVRYTVSLPTWYACYIQSLSETNATDQSLCTVFLSAQC
jgi:hypothetical protein